MRRRRFLALAALLVASVLAWLGLRGWRRDDDVSSEPAYTIAPLADPASRVLFLAVADAIVPRHGGQPAASEIPFAPLFEDWVRAASDRETVYARYWGRFEQDIRARLAPAGDRPDPGPLTELLQEWYRAYRDEARPSVAAQFFEILRRDVLRVYWASPAGWSAVGYPGPARRSRPTGSA